MYGPILVFGGNGTLGSYIIDALHADNSFSSVITASRQPKPPQRMSSSTVYRETICRTCDISNPKQIEALLDDIQPQTIISCAAPKPTASKAIQYQTNYVGTKNLLECARRHPAVQALVYTSSSQALSNVYENGPLKEEDAILYDLISDAPAYHRTKGIADALVLAANIPNPTSTSSAGFLKTAVLRIPALYGPRDRQVSGALIARANTIVTRVQFGDGKARHEWLYLESAALAHVLAAKALLDGRKGIDGEAFFVTDGEPLRFWEFARLMWRAAGNMHCNDIRVVVLPMRVILVISMLIEWLVFVCTLGKAKLEVSRELLRYIETGCWWDIGKARDRLRYVPVCTTEEGVRRTVEWFTK
jgi:sterol-4alpha-carboxylate 3-dehydrogenase (decarboxylating)